MKKISLTKGKFAIVDDDDYEWLSKWKWYCNITGYVVRSAPRPRTANGNIVIMHREITKRLLAWR